ncbi:MAG TPA: LLM class flavin-dependent oxidoreductase [Acidimicrobiia bacterium]|jgi:alkanesulfonate monooxygenase SsuD/methylene tetrahydromethanopterin reductase-like flavin-dependent oxidoreductase (luciferase family)|nr:LLM class flavin-dependent oxidoreductase [Acidimicrobiia bacterium]
MPGRIGIQIGATTPPDELAAIAAEAERLGYSEIWLAEDYFELGGIASAAIALAATEEIRVGLGVVAAVARHPAVTAMEFATLGGYGPHRFMAGIGHGAPGWVRQMALRPASPLGLLREATTAIHDLLGGGELTKDGEYFGFDHIRLTHAPPEPLPLYFGVQGPASLRLAGELVDGTLLGWFSSAGYVGWAKDRIEEGGARADRTDHHEVVALCLLSISDEDPVGARRSMARWAAPMLATMSGSPQLDPEVTGVDPSPLLDPSQPAGLLDELLGMFLAAGDTATCAATVAGLLESGADRVVLVPNPPGYRTTREMVEQIRAASALTG